MDQTARSVQISYDEMGQISQSISIRDDNLSMLLVAPFHQEEAATKFLADVKLGDVIYTGYGYAAIWQSQLKTVNLSIRHEENCIMYMLGPEQTQEFLRILEQALTVKSQSYVTALRDAKLKKQMN